MKLFVHIGQPKTGSSALQGFLNYNRESLASKHGILYPNFLNDKFDTGLLHNHAHFFIEAKRNKDYFGCVKRFTECVDYCQRREINKILISNEGWKWRWWPELLQQVFDATGLDYEIVVYLRRQDKYLESAWKQWGHKLPGCDTIQDYAKKIDLDWYKTLNMWTEYFDADRFIVRPYERAQIGDDIVKDFAGIIGLDSLSGLDAPPATNANTNLGFSRDLVEVLRLSKSLAANEHDNRLIDFMNSMLSDSHKKKPMDEYAFLSPQEKTDIINQYAPSNALVAKQFLKREDARLFIEPLPDLDQNWEPSADLTIEKVIPILMEIMLKQQEQIQVLNNQILNTGKKT